MSEPTFTFDLATEPVIATFILIFLVALMILIYAKFRVFILALIVEIFSLIIGLNALGINGIPISPYFQLFFVLIQTIFFVLITIEVFEK